VIAVINLPLSYLQRASARVQRYARRVALRLRIAQLDNGIANTHIAALTMCLRGAKPLTPEDRAELLDLVRYGAQLRALRAEAAAELHALDMQIAASRSGVRS
jgi:hypothetical protein